MLRTVLTILFSLMLLNDFFFELPKWEMNIGKVAMRASMLIVFLYLIMEK